MYSAENASGAASARCFVRRQRGVRAQRPRRMRTEQLQRRERERAEREQLRIGEHDAAQRRAAIEVQTPLKTVLQRAVPRVVVAPLALLATPVAATDGDADGLPLGLQLIGKALDEQGVLNAGYAIERAANFTAKPERWW